MGSRKKKPRKGQHERENPNKALAFTWDVDSERSGSEAAVYTAEIESEHRVQICA